MTRRPTARAPHRRVPKTSQIPIDQIQIDPSFQIDNSFVKALAALDSGGINAAFTRLPSSLIHTGYYERNGGKTRHVSNLDRLDLTLAERMVRSGYMPSISVYWSPHCPEESKYVAPDEESFLAAYRKLQITSIPCKILRPLTAKTSEASIWCRSINGTPSYVRAISPNIETYPSLIRDHGATINEVVNKLTSHLRDLRDQIKSFHRPEENATHYHEMMYALVLRHEQALDSVGVLINLGRIEHAAAIVRMSYEAFLNFYIDWLSPSFFGPRIQLFSAIQNLDEKTPSDSEAKNAIHIVKSFESLFSKAAEKARLSPLGNIFHDVAYAPLSSIVHQNYSHLEFATSGFSDTSKDPNPDLQRALTQWVDFVTAAMIVRVANDVGKGPP